MTRPFVTSNSLNTSEDRITDESTMKGTSVWLS